MVKVLSQSTYGPDTSDDLTFILHPGRFEGLCESEKRCMCFQKMHLDSEWLPQELGFSKVANEQENGEQL